MDPRVAGAGVAMAIGLMVLLPTFNALNNSYVTDVAPPSWLAKLIDPENIPEDFQPPEDMKIPEDMEIPEDFEPPPDWQIPPGYDGPLPQGGCDNIPPVIREVTEWRDSGSLGPQSSSPLTELTWQLPDTTIGMRVYVNFTNWQAQAIRVEVEGEESLFDEREAGDSTTGGLLVSAQPKSLSAFVYETPEGEYFPPAGPYILRLSADLPIDGGFTTEAYYAVPCGGLLG